MLKQIQTEFEIGWNRISVKCFRLYRRWASIENDVQIVAETVTLLPAGLQN